MAGWVDDLGDGVRKVIRAFHGSPYDFDKFDSRKIGTGEGAQAYGHGLYFAGKEKTAKTYRDSLGRHDPQIDAMVQRLNDLRGGSEYPLRDEVDELVWQIQNARGIAENTPGHMYEVEIGYPEEALLDWDKPMGRGVARRLTPSLRQGLERGVRDRLDMGQLGRHAESLRAMLDDPSLATGQVLHEGLVSDLGSVGAARSMTNAGIPGLRFLDQGSRRAGDGTRNYVIFPGAEDAIKIIRKYGWMLPATMAAGAALDGQPVNR